MHAHDPVGSTLIVLLGLEDGDPGYRRFAVASTHFLTYLSRALLPTVLELFGNQRVQAEPLPDGLH